MSRFGTCQAIISAGWTVVSLICSIFLFLVENLKLNYNEHYHSSARTTVALAGLCQANLKNSVMISKVA